MLDVAADWREIQQEVFSGGDGGHAAVMETALCLAGRAELVRTDLMRAPHVVDLPGRYLEAGEVFLFDEMTDTGALGDAGPATAAGGEQSWTLITQAFANRLRVIDQQDRALVRL
jgi:creatinine amidohydrolase/Fe(II)-dependent formamide hydrolase-like protein